MAESRHPDDTPVSPFQEETATAELPGLTPNRRPTISAERPRGPTIGRYQLLDELGRGGMGVVYRAWDPQLLRPVALKTLRAGAEADPQSRLRLLREARTASRLHHPGIVELYDCFEEDGQVYLTMRLVEGPPLSRLLRERGAFPPEEAARIGLELARALEHAHGQGVIHRDIKPANVLMERGQPVLTDFGLARALETRDHELTRDSQILGTPSYMAPELIRRGSVAAGPRSDQFALGVVLYELLCGRPHVRGSSAHEILAAILSERQDPLPDTVPFQLAWICSRAMAPRPEDRFPDLGELARALERFLRGEQVVRTRDRLEQLRLRASGRLRRPALGALAIALVYGAQRGGTLWWEAREEVARSARADTRQENLERRIDDLRGAGRVEEARALFGSFAELPENRETPALARAWLTEARRRAADGDTDGAEQALTQAYGLSADPAQQVAALVGLAQSFRDRDQWDRLRSALAVLSRRQDTSEEALRLLRRDLAITEGDLSQAQALNEDPLLGPFLATLARVQPLGLPVSDAFPLDTDDDGRAELGIFLNKDTSLTMVRGGGSTRATEAVISLASWTDRRARPRLVRAQDAPPDALVMKLGERCTLGRVRRGALEVVGTYPCVSALTANFVDLDLDGRAEFLTANDRALQVSPADAPEALRALDTTLNHANSEIRGVVFRDLQGDPRPELVVASAGWGAYDVRVLAPEGARWVTLDRVRLGEHRALEPLDVRGEHLFAALQYHDPATPLDWRVFGPKLPHGSPRGVYLFAWKDGHLEKREVLPWLTLPERKLSQSAQEAQSADEDMMVGDLDGDGQDEIALDFNGAWTVLYHFNETGTWQSLILDGRRPLTFIDLDGDGDDELIVRDTASGLAYAIGTGSGALPSLERRPQRPAAPPEDLDPDLRAAWSRAEDLVALGLYEASYDRFLTLAELSASADQRGLAQIRAAEILEERRPEEALRLYEEAASVPELAPRALEAAFGLHDRAMRTEAALAVGERRAALPSAPPALLERVRALRAAAATPTLELDLTQKLDPAWRFDHPEGARASPEGLRITWAGEGAIARLPLRWLGGPASVELDLRTLRQDWSSWLDVGLDADLQGRPERSVSAATTGGGDIYNRTAVCEDVPGGITVAFRPEGLARLLWTYDPRLKKESCSVEDEAGVEQGRVVYDTMQGDPPRDPWLVFRMSGEGAVSDLVIPRMRLVGFEIREAPEEPALQANGLLARGRPEEALEAAGPAPSLARILALDALGRSSERDAALEAALRLDPTLGGRLNRLLLLSEGRLDAPIRAVLQDDWYPVFLRAFDLLMSLHIDEPEAQRMLTSSLDGIERAPPTAITATLLTRRANALRLLGQLEQAEADVERAVGQARKLSDPDDQGALSRALQQQAMVQLARGDYDGAMRSIEEALRVAPAPEVAADVLANRPELAPLLNHPGWTAVERARVRAGPR